MTDAMTPDAAPPPAVPTHPPREYPQALRGPRHRWWRPLLGLAAVVACTLLLFGAMLMYALAVVIAGAVGVQLPDPSSMTDAWFVSPAGLLVTNLGLTLGIPLALVATWAQVQRAGLVSSVLGRVRWRLLLGGIGVALLLLVPLTLAGDLLLTQTGLAVDAGTGSATGAESGAGGSSGEEESGWWPLTPSSSWLALAAVMVLTTPLQAAGEEYFFRGWLSQWIGSLLRWRWLAIAVPAIVTAFLFALAHGSQSPWLFADRLVFGLIASLLVWRTGGLEIAVALHAANNLLAFSLAIAYDGLEESLLITEVLPVEGAASIIVTIITAVVLLWWARRRRPALVVPEPPATGPGWGPVAGPAAGHMAGPMAGPAAGPAGVVGPGMAAMPAYQPGSVSPGSAQPGSVESGTVESGTVESGTAQPGTAQPGTVESGTVEPAKGETT
ncbi:type II CAAX prenyl endopeptidase Rce1 family protein [Promicromonospora vindobonensis]|uniref:Type II CAAX prenyl endopeptidase Rce1 family protein n=1 Tax=Promicromonospora vindobonensis TaxID=195748 RepID=A0ABW5VMT2_9MICO